jgi:hypothetical protein
MPTVLSNFMYRRNAERVETEEPADEEALGRDNNSITEEEGEFIAASTGTRSIPLRTTSSGSSQETPMLEALPDDEDVDTNASTPATNTENNETAQASAGTEAATTAATSTRPRRIHGLTLRDLEEERELVQRRTSGCVLLAGFILLRLWIQSLMTGDFGLLLLCMVFTSWTTRFIRYNREREEELNRLISQWDENAEEAPSTLSDARLTRMSFQSQLALAIMQSQIQLMEGGYGHPDGGERGPGVSDDAKSHWDRFEYKSVADLDQRASFASVAEVKGKTLDEEDPTCSICLCEYDKGAKLVALPCKHVFHEECISSWTDHNTRCPLCNTDLDSVSGGEVV